MYDFLLDFRLGNIFHSKFGLLNLNDNTYKADLPFSKVEFFTYLFPHIMYVDKFNF